VLTAEAGFYRVSGIDQRLALCLIECAAVDESVDLPDKRTKLVAGPARSITIQLETDLVELVDQPITLVLRERAIRDSDFGTATRGCDKDRGQPLT